LKILKAAAFVPDADDDADTVGTKGADDVTSYGKKSRGSNDSSERLQYRIRQTQEWKDDYTTGNAGSRKQRISRVLSQFPIIRCAQDVAAFAYHLQWIRITPFAGNVEY
jgi:hypothetical protein